MRKYYIFILLILIFFTEKGITQFPIYRLLPSNVNQIEPLISRHPTNPQILFASSFTLNLTSLVRNEGCYVTTNGGINWFGSDLISDGFTAFHNGDPGPVIALNGNLVLSHFQSFSAQSNRTYSNYSTNLGTNWSSPISCFPTSNEQLKSSITIDDVSNSSFYGRIYNVTTMVTNPYVIVFNYSTDNGQNWTPNLYQINSSISNRNSNGANITVGEQGQVYVTWASTKNSSPFNELAVGFAKSLNGGINWSANESVYDCNGIFTSQLSPWGIRVNGYPQVDVDKSGGVRNGWIYIVTGEKNLSPAGSDADVILHRSSDGGNTWSAGIRVNQDALNNGKLQFFPAMEVDDNGGINIIYYDTRNIPTNDSLQIYLSRSQDGGNTWRDYLITEQKFYPQPISLGGAGNQGDNIGIISSNGILYPVWMAKYSGSNVYQIWCSNINLNSIGIQNISNEIPVKFSLEQNYPNPFNPTTKIRFTLPLWRGEGGRNLKLIVYDILGKEIQTLVNENLSAGIYEVTFDASKLNSGIYFYRLTTDNFSETKRMIYLK